MNTEKSTFSNLFILLVAILVFLPFITTFQDVLTRIVLHFDAYKAIQNSIVPYEMKILATILNLLGLETIAGPSYIQFLRNGRIEVLYLAWNCIGWQSFILLFVTLISGLSGRYTRASKFQAFLFGVLGTYLVNMFRLAAVIIIYYFTGKGVGAVFHDYFSNLLSIAWLFVYWYLAYKYLLEEDLGSFSAKGRSVKRENVFIRIRAMFSKFKMQSSKFKVAVQKLKVLIKKRKF